MIRTLLLCWLCILSINQVTAQLPDGFIREVIAEGLNPTSLELAPDGRLFLTEKHGAVRIIRDDVLLEDPFLTLEVDNTNERGLGGFILDPDFETNHYVYVFYTVPGINRNRLSRFTANGDYAIPGSEVVLLETDLLWSTVHNGGAMVAGHDGKLYISTGESGASIRARHFDSLLGKILRLNWDGSIPVDNPFFDTAEGKYRAIWAYGFRNPFTIAIHPLTGDIYANDVGGNTWEEVNRIEKGAFYGWDIVEGAKVNHELPEHYRDPVYAYHHSQGCAIVGSTVYAPGVSAFPPQYFGKYFFADYCQGWIKVLDLESGYIQETFMTGGRRIVDLLVDNGGHMYYLERRGRSDGSIEDNTGTSEGKLWKISYTGSGAPFIGDQPDHVLRAIGETARFEIQASGAKPLQYQWYVNDQLIPNANEPIYLVHAVTSNQDQWVYACRVSNGHGSVLSEPAVLTVTANHRPVPHITAPLPGQTYAAGETLSFEGFAEDVEEVEIPSERLTWWIDFHHNTHTHPGMVPVEGISEGSFKIPQTGEIDTNVWYRVHLSAIDQDGLRQTASVDIRSRKHNMSVQTDPPGLSINVDGALNTTPYDLYSVEGMLRTFEAPANQVDGDFVYLFREWQTMGPERIITIEASGDQTSVTAEYETLLLGKGTGLSGLYFDQQDLAGDPVFERVDSVIDFQFFFGSPGPEFHPDNFGIRWEGYVLPYASGNYQFFTIADDGVRLWVDDELLIDKWHLVSAAELGGGNIYLQKDRLYPVRLDYFEGGNTASVELRWASDLVETEIIPQTQLYPVDALQLESKSDFKVEISPNPAHTFLRLRINSLVRKSLPYVLYDTHGREILSGNIDLDLGEHVQEIGVRPLPGGVYFLQFGNPGDKTGLHKVYIN